MQLKRWRQIEDIFQSAIDCEPQSRSAFLDSACGDDAELRREIESLIAQHKDAGFTNSAAFEDGIKVLEHRDGALAEGRRIGTYRVLREIGRGGMGTVYLAARADETFQKLVAIKVLRRGLDTDDIIERFRAERQILAMLEHPNITRLIDGGATEDGRPYFVMEYIEGEPINLYCDRHNLTLAGRLKLFQGVCAAVTYAHQNLVIHRDIKPGNVLVTNEGVPRLLDFGIAKLLEPGTAGGARTLTEARVLTPDYASPEQIRGESITTASDVYSLGALLYELLTGKRASAGGAAGKKPLSGDLENILQMAMRDDPQRRYGSAQQFSEDAGRYLEGQPVIARADTLGYRTSKFIARHKAGVTAAVMLVLTLAGGIVATAWQARVARLETAKAQRINAFLQDTLGFGSTMWDSSNVVKNPDAKLSDAIEMAAARAGTALADQPDVQAEMRLTIGHVYNSQSRFKQAEQILRPALETQIRIHGPNDVQAARTANELALALWREGNLDEAEKFLRGALNTLRKEAGTNQISMSTLVSALGNMGGILDQKGDLKAAESYYLEALQHASSLTGKDRATVAMMDQQIGGLRYRRGDLDGAERFARDALAEYRSLPTGNYWEPAVTMVSLGTVLTRKGRFEEAEPLMRQAVEIARKSAGNMHYNTAGTLAALADLLYYKADYQGAEYAANESLHIYEQTLPKGNIRTSLPQLELGLILNKTGRSRAGEKDLREVLALRSRLLPPGDQNLANAEGALGECLTTQKRFAEAEPLLLRGYAETKSNLGEQDPRTVEARQRLKSLYLVWHKPEKAAAY